MCLGNKVNQAQDMLGLHPEIWSVVATVSQALAAIGALALLYITWRSGKDTKAAIENSRKLAEATDNLVIESRAQQKLAVLPVVEFSYEREEGRIRVVNKGNGPLLKPKLDVNGKTLKLLGQSEASAGYSEVAALSTGGGALINLDASMAESGSLSISGLTLAGNEFSACILLEDFAEAERLVADHNVGEQ